MTAGAIAVVRRPGRGELEAAAISRIGRLGVVLLIGSVAVTLKAAGDARDGFVNLTPEGDSSSIELRAGEELRLRLRAIPGAGYSWHVASIDVRQIVKLEPAPPEPIEEPRPGGAVFEVLRFRALRSGRSVVELAYRRIFELGVPPLRTHTVHVHVLPDSSGPSSSQQGGRASW